MRIGFTCSAFDLLHSGHVVMLQEAKEQCDYLIVGLQTNPQLDRPEKRKPLQSILERYLQLNACKYIDKIIPYDTEEDLENLLTILPIDVRIIGQEYTHKNFTGKQLDIPIYYNKRGHNYSSTSLRERMQ